jgi:glutaredoxin
VEKRRDSDGRRTSPHDLERLPRSRPPRSSAGARVPALRNEPKRWAHFGHGDVGVIARAGLRSSTHPRVATGDSMALKRDSTDSKGTEGLALYGYSQCPYCSRVLHAIDSLGLEIPLRNTLEDRGNRAALVEAMGRGTVPVLRIEDAEGHVEWLPESADIIRYLVSRFGEKD